MPLGIWFKPQIRFGLFGLLKFRFSINNTRSVYLKTGNRQFWLRFIYFGFWFKPRKPKLSCRLRSSSMLGVGARGSSRRSYSVLADPARRSQIPSSALLLADPVATLLLSNPAAAAPVAHSGPHSRHHAARCSACSSAPDAKCCAAAG